MPEHLKALVFILVLATVVFAVAKTPACAVATTSKDFERRRNLWFALTLTAFLAHNFWVFIVVAAAVLHIASQGEQNKLAMFYFVLFALPRISDDIPGLGIVSVLFAIDYVRLLTLIVFLPAYLAMRKQPGTEPFGSSLPDKILTAFMILGALMMLDQGTLAQTLTFTLREGVFYAFTDVFLPYYVASRCVKNLQEFRDVLMAFAVAGLVLSATLITESAMSWLFYATLEEALGTPWGWSSYVFRDGNLRATGTVGYSIVAGFVVAVAAAFFFYAKKIVPNATVWGLGAGLLLGGLIVPLSRGPWVGCAVMVAVFVATGPAPARGFVKIGLLCLLALPFLLATSVGNTILDYLPWVGTLEASTVVGRQQLIDATVQILLENPLFGTRDYADTPAMRALAVANGGFLDLTNTYVVVGLSRGFVGLSLFGGFFLVVGIAIYNSMRRLTDKNDEHYRLGQTLLATLIGILVIIGTISPVVIIPTVYWSMAGLGIAYARMLARGMAPGTRQPATPQADAGRRRRVPAPYLR